VHVITFLCVVVAVLDAELMHSHTISGGAGSRDRLIELRVEDALKLTDGIIADISKR